MRAKKRPVKIKGTHVATFNITDWANAVFVKAALARNVIKLQG